MKANFLDSENLQQFPFWVDVKHKHNLSALPRPKYQHAKPDQAPVVVVCWVLDLKLRLLALVVVVLISLSHSLLDT